jgi:hypothetical protein
MIRNPATRWNQAKTTRLRDCTIATKISNFIPEAWISGSQKSSEISQDEVFADHEFSTIPVVAFEASSPTQMTSQERLNLILGRWVFTYTTTKRITHTYTINATYEDTSDPGEYYAAGWNESSEPVIAGWSDDLDAYALLDPGTNLDEFYVFSLIDSNSVAGCAHLANSVTGYFSDCYPMTGYREASFSSLRTSSLRHESQFDEGMKAIYKGRSLGGGDSTPDPAILKELERLKSIRTSH